MARMTNREHLDRLIKMMNGEILPDGVESVEELNLPESPQDRYFDFMDSGLFEEYVAENGLFTSSALWLRDELQAVAGVQPEKS